MNLVLVIVLIFLLLSMLNGYRRGLIKSVVSTFAFIVAIIFAMQLGPVMGKALRTTPAYTVINRGIESAVTDRIDTSGQKVTDQIEAIENLPIPQSLRNVLIENNNSQIYEALGISSFSSYLSDYLTCMILNAIAHIIVFIIVFIIIKVIGYMLNLISKLPVLNGINKAGGLIFGLVNGLVMVWIGCVVVTVFGWTSWGGLMLDYINESSVLSFIYAQNIFMNSISNMGRFLF